MTRSFVKSWAYNFLSLSMVAFLTIGSLLPATQVFTVQIAAAEESEDSNEPILQTEIDLSVEADEVTENSVEFDLNTGRNEIGNNTVVAGLETGQIDATANLLNTANSELGEGSTFLAENVAGGDSDIVLFNPDNPNRIDISGGDNEAKVEVLHDDNVVHIFDSNNNETDNLIDVVANTGENSVSNNTKIDELSTGDINLGVNLINLIDLLAPELQLTIDVWNILGDFSGDILVAPDSQETGIYEDTIAAKSQTNTDVSNYFDLSMNTGENNFGSNTLVGDVTTGDAKAKTNMTTLSQIATPIYYILNVFGLWDGNYGGLDPEYTTVNIIDGSSPGYDEVITDNNIHLENRINIEANTGRNDINRNTIVGNILTGDINVAQNVVNVLNSMSTKLKSFRLGIINIFGSWTQKEEDEGCDDTDDGQDEVIPTMPVDEGAETTTLPDRTATSVLGVQRNIMTTLPEAGADISAEASELEASSESSPVKTPIWGLLTVMAFASAIALAARKRINLDHS